jgi:hypothetical protein
MPRLTARKPRAGQIPRSSQVLRGFLDANEFPCRSVSSDLSITTMRRSS